MPPFESRSRRRSRSARPAKFKSYQASNPGTPVDTIDLQATAFSDTIGGQGLVQQLGPSSSTEMTQSSTSTRKS